MKKENEEIICDRCNGYGKERRNYTNQEGKYVFHKIICVDCNGTGVQQPLSTSSKESPKPCPFCGCGHIDLFPNDEGYLTISCSHCAAKIETWTMVQRDAIAEWNKRVI